jgi:hypothetical protein
MLVPATAHRYAESLLRGAGIFAELLPAPLPAQVNKARENRLLEQLSETAENTEEHAALAARLLEHLGPEALVRALLARLAERDVRAPYPLTPTSDPRHFGFAPGPRRDTKARSSHAVFRPRAKQAHSARHR